MRAPVRPPHPPVEQLERFLRGELPREEVRAVVRHLLAECAVCREVTGRLWALGERMPLSLEGDL